MGTNSPYFPSSVDCDEEAIVYLGMMISALKSQTYTAVTGSPTATAAQMVGGVIEISGGVTATITTDTAANIIARMLALDANSGIGSTANFSIVNGNTGTVTLAAGANVTLVGVDAATILTDTAKRYQIKQLTATTVSVTQV